MSTIQTLTFWQLVNKYIIEIPLLQRDFAQGRNDKKSEEIREKFLNDLLESLSSAEKKSIELDFVYGKIKENTFIPIDGQQRLTTLFLLHWYISQRTIGSDEKLQFKNISFTYETRVSSRDFCKALINYEIDFAGLLVSNCNNDKSLSKSIKNEAWFFLSWKKDPTVQAMLNMLDAIHVKFKDCDYKLIWKHLVKPNYILSSDNPKLNELIDALKTDRTIGTEIKDALAEVVRTPAVSFKFLNLDEFQLSDELYLKMNARGKGLSDFENFKAWLIGYVGSEGFSIIEDNWQMKLDKKWTDLFWKFKGINNIIDFAYMRFFVELALFSYAKIKGANSNEKVFTQNIQNLAFTQDRNIEFYSNKYFEELGCFSDVSLNFTFNSLDILLDAKGQLFNDYSIQSYIEVENLLIKLTSTELKFTYSDRVLLYSFLLFITEKDYKKESEKLFDWMRIIRNLIENTTINSSSFSNAIRAISELNKFSFDILKSLVAGDCDKIPFFGTQIIEEKQKAILIESNPNTDWEKEIIDVENHPPFKGNIHFLLPGKDEVCDLDTFKKRKAVAMQLFEKDGSAIDNHTNILGRILIALGLGLDDNTLRIGGIGHKDWKKHLKDEHFIPYIKQAVNMLLDIEPVNYLEAFNSFFKSNNDQGLESWQKILIYNPILFSEYSNYCKIKEYYGGIYLFQSENFSQDTNGILISNNRNEIITELLESGEYSLKNPYCKKCGKFYSGEKIELLDKDIRLVFEIEKVKLFIPSNNKECFKEYNYIPDEGNSLMTQIKNDVTNYFSALESTGEVLSNITTIE